MGMLRNGTLECLHGLGQVKQPLWAFSDTLWQQLLENKVLGIDTLCFPPTQHAHVIPLFHRGQLAGTLLAHGLSSPIISSQQPSQGTDYVSAFQS